MQTYRIAQNHTAGLHGPDLSKSFNKASSSTRSSCKAQENSEILVGWRTISPNFYVWLVSHGEASDMMDKVVTGVSANSQNKTSKLERPSGSESQEA